MKLRHYQVSAINSVCNDKFDNGIIVIPTAGGKSIVIAEIGNYYSKKCNGTLVLQPNKEILEQNYEKYSLYNNNATIFSASLGSKEIGDVTFATIGSVIKHLDKFLHIKTIIVDEVHLVSSIGQYAKLIKALTPKQLIGLSATPFRNNTKNNFFGNGPKNITKCEMLTRKRDSIFKNIAYKYEIADAVREGYWAKIRYNFPIKYDTRALKVKGSDYDDKAIEEHNFSINLHDTIVDIVRNTDKKHCLVFLTTIAECEHTVNLIQKVGISCEVLTGKTSASERTRMIAEFKAGKIKCMLSVGTLSTGFDFPELDCLIFARPTQSLSLYYQILGRIVRIHTSKEYGDVYDLCGNVDNFGKIETLRFVGDDLSRLGLVSDIKILIPPTKSYMAKKITEGMQNIGFVMLQSGKYNGKTVQEVHELDKQYMMWNIENNTSFAPLFNKFFEEQSRIAKIL